MQICRTYSDMDTKLMVLREFRDCDCQFVTKTIDTAGKTKIGIRDSIDDPPHISWTLKDQVNTHVAHNDLKDELEEVIKYIIDDETVIKRPDVDEMTWDKIQDNRFGD